MPLKLSVGLSRKVGEPMGEPHHLLDPFAPAGPTDVLGTLPVHLVLPTQRLVHVEVVLGSREGLLHVMLVHGVLGRRYVRFEHLAKAAGGRLGIDYLHADVAGVLVVGAAAHLGHRADDVITEPTREFTDFAPAEEAIAATGADIRRGGGQAFYRPSEDYIQLPFKSAFQGEAAYYSTSLHELAHWTGHESRLNRIDKLSRLGSESYAAEELVAELGASFLTATLGIPVVQMPDEGGFVRVESRIGGCRR